MYNENLTVNRWCVATQVGNKTVSLESRAAAIMCLAALPMGSMAPNPFVYSFECRSYRHAATRHYGPIARTTLHIKGPKLQFNLFRTCLGNGIAITGKTIPPFIEGCLIALIANYNYCRTMFHRWTDYPDFLWSFQLRLYPWSPVSESWLFV